jgi:hypothetical protein
LVIYTSVIDYCLHVSVSSLEIHRFLTRFHRTRPTQHGIVLNFTKTKILTSTNGESPLALLPPADAEALQAALTFLSRNQDSKPELTSGVRLLGQPIGSREFIDSFLQQSLDSFQTDIHRLNQGFPDLQSRSTIFRFCTRPTIDHLLASDFLNNATLLFTSDATHFDSHVTRTIDNLTQTFVQRLTAYRPNTQADSPLPAHTVTILYFPAAHGGVGYRSPYVAATASFVLPIARSIRLASQGLSNPSDPSSPTILLPPTIRNVLSAWQHDDSRVFRLFRRYGELLLAHHFPDSPESHSDLTILTEKIELKGLRRDLYRKHYKNQRALLEQDPHTSSNLISLTSPLTSFPLHSMSRKHKDHRLDNDHFRVALQRKLRLPVLPPELQNHKCDLCGATIDPECDHLFSCRHSKTNTHNFLRDALTHVVRILGPLAGFTDSPQSVTRETLQLLPHALRRRPADVGMHLQPSYLLRQSPQAARFLAIDVNVPKPPSSTHDAPLSAETATSKHHDAEREKFNGRYDDSRIASLNDLVSQNILFLPFIVDHLGGLGPLAHRFLYGPDPDRAPAPTLPRRSQMNSCSLTLLNRAYGPLGAVNLLGRADEQWLAQNPDQRYGPSYHTSLPSQWATQFLGLNITTALTSRILTHLKALKNPSNIKSKKDLSIGEHLYVPTRMRTKLRSVRGSCHGASDASTA